MESPLCFVLREIECAQRFVRQGASQATLGRHLAWALVVGVAYWPLARYSLALPVKASGISYIWPADGLALAALLLAPPAHLADLPGRGLLRQPPRPATSRRPPAILYSLFNVAEPLLVATIIARTMGLRPEIGRLRNAAVFIGLIVGAMAVAIFISNSFDWLIHRGDFWRTWSIWYVSDTLGMLLVAPLSCPSASSGASSGSRRAPRSAWKEWRCVIGAAIVTYGTFGQPELARAILGFTPTPLLLPAALLFWAVLRFGMFFGMATLAVIALQAFRYTSAGLGPIAGAHDELPSRS